MIESTAGAYLGKYLSATFGSLLDATESFEESKTTARHFRTRRRCGS